MDLEKLEKKSLPESRLELVLEDMKRELDELKSAVSSGKLTPEQCIDIENKCRKLISELSVFPYRAVKPS